jgi:hypothetical protein
MRNSLKLFFVPLPIIPWLIVLLITCAGQEKEEGQGEKSQPVVLGDTFSLHHPVYRCVFDAKSGAMVTLNERRSSITWYPEEYFDPKTSERAAARIKTVQVPADSQLIAVKPWQDSALIVVASQSTKILSVFELKTLKLEKQVFLDGSPISLVASPGPEDPSVYFTIAEGPLHKSIPMNEIRRYDISDYSQSRLRVNKKLGHNSLGIAFDGRSFF